MSKPSFHKKSSSGGESKARVLLRRMATGELPRNRETLQELSEAIEHPSQLAETVYLAEDDPLRLRARRVLDDFEAATNGMSRPQAVDPDQSDPLYPWQLLINAVLAFYDEDFAGMRQYSASIPAESPARRLVVLFENLAGKPAHSKAVRKFTNLVFQRREELENGLELMEEASAYPHLLREIAPAYLKILAEQDCESARRLCLWVLSTLADSDPLGENELSMASIVFGKSEAARMMAIASIPLDPDRALLYWLRSLNGILVEGGADGADIKARLSIARDLWHTALNSDLLGKELAASAGTSLFSAYPMLKSLLPGLPPLPDDNRLLFGWLTAAAQSPRHKAPKPGGKNSKPRLRKTKQLQMSLFSEQKIP